MMAILTSLIGFSQEDKHQWLEDVEGEKQLEWVKAQNKITAERIQNQEGFQALKQQYLDDLNDDEKIDYPRIVGDYVYNFWKDENHVRGIWRRTSIQDYKADKDNWNIILDLDKLSKKEDKKWVFSGVNWLAPDYKICLLSLSDGGTDENIVREFNVDTKEFVKDGFYLPSSKGSIAWLNENQLLIGRNFGEGTLTTSGYPRIVKLLNRGQKIEEATVILERDSSLMGVWPFSQYIDGEYVTHISVSHNFYKRDLYRYLNGELIKYEVPQDADFTGIYKGFGLWTLNSDWETNKKTLKQGALVSLNYKKLLKNKIEAKTVYQPNEKSSIDGVSITKDALLINTIENVKSVLYKSHFEKKQWINTAVETPEFGNISVIDASRTRNDYFYQYSNFITPPTLYFVDKNQDIVRQGKEKFKAANLEVNQHEVLSKDGTSVPYFIIHKKDIELNGNNPTLVYAYGGFNVSITPSYSTRTGIGWLEKGGVYVIANIRGGGEFGPKWHHAALKEKRQNAYNDFYAVCEDLIKRNITSPKHLGAMGWSNGGLMAGVVTTQRPDLFSAVIIGAPLLDMKRFNKLLAGASWMGEYGNPDTEDWEFIKKYSPYHNVHKEKTYPEVFIITSTKDDRVHPGHARKMAAKMQDQGHPALYYETIEGGHRAASTNEQSAFNQALMFQYLAMKLMTE